MFHSEFKSGLLRRILIYIVLSMPLCLACAQTIQPVYFSSLTTRNGLSSNITNSIVQDKYGFIWIGTQEGVCRYDGFQINVFQNQNTPGSISSNNISSLLYDDEQIWVGTWDGLNTIDIHTFEVKHINTGNARVIRVLYKDNDNKIWIGTSEGLLVYDKSLNEFMHYNISNSSLSHNTIRSLYQSSNGDMWIGTYDKLNRFSQGKFTSFDLKGNYKPMLENNLIVHIQPYKPGIDSLLWVGTETGLALFNTYSGNFTLFNASNTSLSNEVIKCIFHQNDTLLWLGTDFGLNIINTKNLSTETWYHDPLIDHTITSNVIWEIFEDRQNRLWLITSNGVSIAEKGESLYTFHEQYFSSGSPRIGNQVKDILVTSGGEIWLATIHGVVRRDPVTGRQKVFSISSSPAQRILLNNVYALKEDKNRRIWMGTAGGINIWDESQNKMYSITANRENGLLSNYISGFAIDSDDNIWVTAWEGGLFRIDWDGAKPESMRFILVDPNGDGRMVASDDLIYYGTNHSLQLIDIRTMAKSKVESINKILQTRQLSGLHSGKDGTLWIGTSHELIHFFPSRDSICIYPVQTGRPQKLINIQEDLLGNMWATTSESIIQFSIDKSEQILIPIHPSLPMKGFYQFCSDITPEGHILFGGDNGFISIDPFAVDAGSDIPQVFISGLLINNQQISPADSIGRINMDIAFAEKLRLRHHQNSLTFEFTTLDFLFPGFVQFQYRMIPVQEEWILTSGEKNFAVFANLKPGKYLFEVKGSNRYGIWSNPHTLHINIRPSVWLSQSMIALYIFLALAISWYTYRVYSNRRRLHNELRIIRLEKQHSEELYQTKIRFFTNISHEFRTPLSLIIPPIQELLKGNTVAGNQEKLLKMANRNALRLYKLVNQLLDFRKIEANKLELAVTSFDLISFCHEIFNSFDDMALRNEIEYTFESEPIELYVEADREKIETIIFNLISNALKYTPVNGKVSVEIRTKISGDEKGWVSIMVRDTGIGITNEEQDHIFEEFYQTKESKSLNKGSGIGLTLAQEYALLHKGVISVSSQPGEGSTFEFSMPIVSNNQFTTSQGEAIFSGMSAAKVEKTSNSLPGDARKIVVIDDNEDILDFIEMNIRDQYHVTLARNGLQGLTIIENQLPDLIISDVMMPIMDGIELCQKIKENKSTVHIPVILLTARSLEIQKTEGINKGADLYITKPFDISYLKSCIESVFRRKEQLEKYIKTQLLVNPERDSLPADSQDDLFLKKVMSLIEHNISDPELSVELISDTLGMSATHLYRKLKETTGYSTKEIIMNYRMQKAAGMIANKEGNISEIMYAVGFSSLSGFSRSFKAKFGVSPTAYN